jgi:K+-transporting ATPase KdpF subunit
METSAMLDLLYIMLGAGMLAMLSATPLPSTVCDCAMLIAAFLVTLALAVFLLATLLRPEQF